MARILRNVKSRKNLIPCPFCGGVPEFVLIEGGDVIMRCSSCHASTVDFYMYPRGASRAWNRKDIVDDNISLAEDFKIDEYFYNIKKILFWKYPMNENPPYYGEEFMTRHIVIVAEKMMLSVEAPDDDYLSYEEISGYGEYVDALEIGNEKVEFLESEWNGDKLVSLKFKTENSMFSISCAFNCGWISVVKKKTNNI